MASRRHPLSGSAGSGAARNTGVALDASAVRAVRVDAAEVERRAAAAMQSPMAGRQRIEWLVRAVQVMDLTSLSGDETVADVKALCARAASPLPSELCATLGLSPSEPRVAAVCVHRQWIGVARTVLGDAGVRVAAVAGGFPEGAVPLVQKVAEVRECVVAGADEVDAVITRAYARAGEWQSLYDEVCELRAACDGAVLKVILAAGDLGSLDTVARASLVAMQAGADFIKSSTGKEKVNATGPIALVMAEAIRSYQEATGHAVGLKPSGGIRTADQALGFLALVREVLGQRWLEPDRFRLGASGLLADVARALEQPANRGG